jgi:phosphoribosylglycinamide formyltransferase 1
MLRLVILASGRGSHFDNIVQLSQQQAGTLNIAALLCDNPTAPVIEKARQAGISVSVAEPSQKTRAIETTFLQEIADKQPEVVLLAGYMRLLSRHFIEACPVPILNIHPSLLPKYKGLHTHAQVLATQDRMHGATVHVVTPQLDDGPLIAAAQLPILTTDTPESLAARLLPLEHRLYACVIGWLAGKRLYWNYEHRQFMFDQQPLPPYGLAFEEYGSE